MIYTLSPSTNQSTYRLRLISLAGQWSTATIFEYLRSPTGTVPSSAIRILETLLKQALLPVTHCEGSFFYSNDSRRTKQLPDGFELRLGFFQALCLTQAGLTLNLQTTLTKFYPYMDIIDFLTKYLKKDIRKYGMNSNDYMKARTVLNGCKITTQQSNHTQVGENLEKKKLKLTFFLIQRSIKFEVFPMYPNDKHFHLQKKSLKMVKQHMKPSIII